MRCRSPPCSPSSGPLRFRMLVFRVFRHFRLVTFGCLSSRCRLLVALASSPGALLLRAPARAFDVACVSSEAAALPDGSDPSLLCLPSRSFVLPWFLACIVPIGWLYYRVARAYSPCSRELNRLVSLTRSPGSVSSPLAFVSCLNVCCVSLRLAAHVVVAAGRALLSSDQPELL